ncbi:MAG: hypothetical protein O3A13_15040 [Proteobacteria bacterium]|nr:hypothetical protein [Pseudomonadota bacterium]
MADNFQRRDAISNAHVGREFERRAIEAFADAGISLRSDFSVKVGVSDLKKTHKFDLGSEEPPVIVECKSHRWTKGSNVPSAKMTVWNEAMYYFSFAPSQYRKILFVLRDTRATTGETLSQYYIRTYSHLIPHRVEIWEYDEASASVGIVHGK